MLQGEVLQGKRPSTAFERSTSQSCMYRFAELYQQLATYDGLSSKGRYALLSLLQQLTEEGATAIASSILRYRPLQLPKVNDCCTHSWHPLIC